MVNHLNQSLLSLHNQIAGFLLIEHEGFLEILPSAEDKAGTL